MKRNPINVTYKIHGHDLEVVKEGKYLGVTIADNLTWNNLWMKLQKRQTTPLLSCGGMLQGAQVESRLNATPLLSSLWWSTQLLPGTHTLPDTFSSLKQSSAEQPGLSLVTTILQAVPAR